MKRSISVISVVAAIPILPIYNISRNFIENASLAGLDVICVIPVLFGFFSMEPSELKPNTKEVVEAKAVKEIAERAVSLETKASAKSAVDHLDSHGLEAAPVTDAEGTLVGKISKDRMIRGVSGRGHDPQTTPVEPEVVKEGEPYCYEHESIAK